LDRDRTERAGLTIRMPLGGSCGVPLRAVKQGGETGREL
jgi:hypothetical protein